MQRVASVLLQPELNWDQSVGKQEQVEVEWQSDHYGVSCQLAI